MFTIGEHYVVTQGYICGLEEGASVGDQEIVVYNNRTGEELYAYVDKTNAYGTIHVSGATLAIYACNEAGEKGDLFERWISDGTTHKSAAIKSGRYMLVEEAAPAGYVTANPIFFEVSDTSVSVKIREENTILQVRKVDPDGNVIAGCELEIWSADAAGNKVALWKSFTTGRSDALNVITGIPVGRYILTEKKAPEGFALASDVAFEIIDKPGVQTVTMRDEPITVLISKVDITTSEELSGATLEIWTLNNSGQPVSILDKFTSTGQAHQIKKHSAGKYLLRETHAPAGYVKSNDMVFEVRSTGEIQTVQMKDDYIKVSFTKTEIHTGDAVAGATMGLYQADEAGNRVSVVRHMP